MTGVSVLEYPTPQEALDNEPHVYFPPGAYFGSFKVHSYQTVEGAGPGALGTPEAGGTVLVSRDGAPVIQAADGLQSLPNLILRDFAVVHEGVGPAAIELPNLRSSTLEQVAAHSDKGDALRIAQQGSTPTWLNRFQGCLFRVDQKYAVSYEGTDSIFQGCVFSGGQNQTGSGALDLGAGGNRYIGCQAFRAVGGGAALEIRISSNASKITSVSGCYLDESLGNGLRIFDPEARSGPANVVVVGCSFRSNAEGDVRLDGVGGVVVVDNVLHWGLEPDELRVVGQNLGPNLLYSSVLAA